MRDPNSPVNFSYAPAGSMADMAEMEVRVVVTSNQDGEPIGVLEWWGSACWIYAEVDCLRPVEPAKE